MLSLGPISRLSHTDKGVALNKAVNMMVDREGHVVFLCLYIYQPYVLTSDQHPLLKS